MSVVDVPSAADISKCVHCGLCLQHCPTYLETGNEMESPRGRLHLIGALNEGRIQANAAYSQHIDLCLVCRACENVCPSGVPFGRIMERARTQLVQRRPGSWNQRLLRWAVFHQLLPKPRRLPLLAGVLRHYQRSGLQRLVRTSGLLRLLPGHLDRAEAQLPRLRGRFFRPRLEVFPAVGQRRYRVGFFSGCVMPYLYSEVHAATLRVLRVNGCEVVIPPGQVCCGALNVHSGEREMARQMARRNIEAFLAANLDAVIVNAAGCGSTLKEYHELLDHPPAGAPQSSLAYTRGISQSASPGGVTHASLADAERFTSLVKDVNEFLVSIDLEPPTHPVRRRVTLQESCHLVHAQRIKAAPRQLLGHIPGLVLVDMAHPDLCCGSAGIYNLTQPEMAAALLSSKMADAQATGADTIVTANPGCMLQLEQGVRQSGVHAEVKHVVQLLDEAYGSVSAP